MSTQLTFYFSIFVIHSDIQAPKFTVKPKSKVVARGKAVFLNCAASGKPEPVISWYYGSHKLTSDSKTTIHSNGTLAIQNFESIDKGKYKCEAKNVAGSVTEEITLSLSCEYSVYKNI